LASVYELNNTVLLVLFAVIALCLASMGLYGVLSQLVSARRREIGVRIALGARPSQIVASITAQAASVTGIGIAAGLAGALALARFMSTLVFDIPARDPLTYAIVLLLVACVAAITALVPACRAARVTIHHVAARLSPPRRCAISRQFLVESFFV